MRAARALVPLALIASVAGCAADGEPGSTPATSSSGSSATSAPITPDVPLPTGTAAAGGETAPGTQLGLGDAATVELITYQGERTGMADLTVNSIEMLPEEDFANAGGQDRGDALWLLQASLTITERGEDLSSVYPTVDLTGESDGVPLPKPGIELSEAADCDQTVLDRDAEVGDTVDFCVGAVTEGGQVVAAAWSPARSDYSYRDGMPIVWNP